MPWWCRAWCELRCPCLYWTRRTEVGRPESGRFRLVCQTLRGWLRSDVMAHDRSAVPFAGCPSLLWSRCALPASVTFGEVLERLTRGGDGARDIASSVDPIDPHDALCPVEEAVRHTSWHPCGVAGDQIERLLPDLRHGLALNDEDGLLDVVAVEGKAGPGCELRLAGRDPVGLAVPPAEIRDGDDTVAAVEGLDLVGSDQQAGREWMVRHESPPGLCLWP